MNLNQDMKRVIIVRHAKAVPYGYDNDFTRDLSDRGERDSKAIGNELQKMGVQPDMFISSPAKRAIKTARNFANSLNFDQSLIVENEDIYDGLTTTGFIELNHRLPETAQIVFFFGHNPGFHYFVSNLATDFYGDMPTCSTVAIDFDVTGWPQVKARTGKVAFHLVPRDL